MSIPTKLKINIPFVIHDTFDDETIIINLKSGNYYSIANTAAVIWQIIEKKTDFNFLVKFVPEISNIPPEKVAASIIDFISELLQEGLIIEEEELSSLETLNFSKDDNLIKELSSVFESPVLNKYSDMQDFLKLNPIYDTDEKGWPKSKN